MAERSLRGTRLGSMSYEDDRDTDLAPRQEIAYDCPQAHTVVVTFAEEAEIPTTWECRTCGMTALRRDTEQDEEKKQKAQRTHWDMLLERRSIDELEQLLEERLQLLRQNNASGKQGKQGKESGSGGKRSA